MLLPAQLHTEELKKLFLKTAYDEKYKFYHSGYHDTYDPSDSTWGKHEFVSVDSNNNVLGYIAYTIDRYTYVSHNFHVINFSENKATFGRDLCQAIDDMFLKYGLGRVEYSVVIGNPIEESYDKMTQKYGGTIIGVRHKSTRLSDGKWYDEKLYEILKEDYLNAKLLKKRKLEAKNAPHTPKSCYEEYGSDLDGCWRQNLQGCAGCSQLTKEN